MRLTKPGRGGKVGYPLSIGGEHRLSREFLAADQRVCFELVELAQVDLPVCDVREAGSIGRNRDQTPAALREVLTRRQRVFQAGHRKPSTRRGLEPPCPRRRNGGKQQRPDGPADSLRAPAADRSGSDAAPVRNPLHLEPDVAHRLESVVGILRQTYCHQMIQRRRGHSEHFTERRRIVLQDRTEHARLAVAPEGRARR